MAFIVPYGQLSKACSMTAYLNSKLGMPFPDSFTIILSPAILRRLHGALEVSPACPRANRAISAASSNTLRGPVSAKIFETRFLDAGKALRKFQRRTCSW